VLDLLEDLRPGPKDADLRSFEWYYLWRLCHQGHRLTLKVPNSQVWCLAFSPDGKTVAAGCGDTSIRLWEAATGRQQATWTGKEGPKIPCLAFARDGKTVVAPGLREPKSVTRWDLATGRAENVLNGLPATVLSMAYTSNGKTLATGYADGTISLWDTTTWREQARLRGETDRVTCVAFSPDGRKLAAAVPWGPDNGRIQIWDWASRPACVSWKLEQAYCLAFSPDGEKLAAVGTQGAVRLYEASTGRPCASFHGHSGSVFAMAFAPDGKTLASGGNDRTVRLWEVDTGQPRVSYADSGPVYAVAFSPDNLVLASAGYDGTITFRDAAPAQRELVLPGGGAFVAFSPDGKTLASAGTKALKLWDVATWKATTLPLGGGADPSESLVFSHDGKTLAVARSHTLKLFDVKSSQERSSHEGPNIFWSVAVSPDGKTLASARNGAPEITLWDLPTQQVRATLTPDPAALARVSAFSPDGTNLATGRGFGLLKLFDPATGQERAILRPANRGVMDWIFCLAFSPDGSLLASDDMRGIVKLWEAPTGKLRATLKGHVDAVLCLTFSSDGRTLATGGDDLTVKLWDVATGQERITLKRFTAAVRSLVFAPNDTLLAAGSWDGTVRVWRAATDAAALARRADPVSEH
jgi:WD40 repeat protein